MSHLDTNDDRASDFVETGARGTARTADDDPVTDAAVATLGLGDSAAVEERPDE